MRACTACCRERRPGHECARNPSSVICVTVECDVGAGMCIVFSCAERKLWPQDLRSAPESRRKPPNSMYRTI